MISTASIAKAQPIPTEFSAEQHTIPQTLLLHLLPGALITLAFILLGPWLKLNHLPRILAILLPILFVLIPLELGILFYQGYRRNGRLSLEGIVLYRERLPVKEYILFPLLLVVWIFFGFWALANVDQAILTTWFGWLPGYFDLSFSHFNPAEYSRTTVLVTFFLLLALNGIAGPAVEELYFRGYLLPRMQKMKGWAPLVNAVLFSLYHFFAPAGNPSRIVGVIPMVYTVQWKKNIYLGMLAHCLLNTINCLVMIPLFFR
jgi:membrane protease YdiL (CAAX protease family)